MFPRLSLPLTISLGLAVLVGGVGVIVLVFRSEKTSTDSFPVWLGFDAMKAFALSVVVQTGFFMINGTASYMLVSQVLPSSSRSLRRSDGRIRRRMDYRLSYARSARRNGCSGSGDRTCVNFCFYARNR